MTYHTHFNLLASAYGSSTYDSTTYGGSTNVNTNTGSNTSGTGAASTSSGGTTSRGILTNTGFDMAVILTLAVVMMFIAILVRYWKKPGKNALSH